MLFRLAVRSPRLASSATRNVLRLRTQRLKSDASSQAQLVSTGKAKFLLGGAFGVAATVAIAALVSGGATHTEEISNVPGTKHGQQQDGVENLQGGSTISVQGMPAIRYDLSEENVAAAQREFVDLLGTERVNLDLAERISHSSTAWSEAPRGALDRPACIVCPRTTEEVSQIARICHTRRIPLIGYSGGTSLEGTLAAIHGGVCIDFALMNRILTINRGDVDVVVQPGVGYEELNQQLAPEGLFFPPDPGPGAQIGGMISQGCSGTNAYRYGTVKDWVLGLTVVLADGTIIKTRGRPRKSSSGYNLTQLMVGSEGTLGLITEASLKVTAAPQNEQVAVASFPNLHAAVAAAVSIVRSGMSVGAMELLDEMSMRAINLAGYCSRTYDEQPHLFFKFHGASRAEVTEQIGRVKTLAREAGCGVFETSSSSSNDSSDKNSDETDEADEAAAIWAARKTALWSILALKKDPDRDGFVSSDTAVPIGRLAEAIEAARKVTSGAGSGTGNEGEHQDGDTVETGDSGLLSAFIGHVGDGNVHTAVLYRGSSDEDDNADDDRVRERNHQRARAAIQQIQRQAIRLDGTVTGEHGIGLEFRDMLVEELGAGAIDAMRQIKLALDPRGILNPDKVFRLNIASSSSSPGSDGK